MKKLLTFALILPLLAGCSYALSPETVKKADRSISFDALLNDPAVFAGKVVILGGEISQTTKVKSGTVVEVVQKELDYWGKPQRTRASGGRFLVLANAFLDPTIYAPGREITVGGEVLDPGRKDLPENPYELPMLRSVEMKLWQKEPQSGDRPSWWDPLHDPDAKRGI